jgi:hypothetical protein
MPTKRLLGCVLVLSCLAACSAEPISAPKTPALTAPQPAAAERLPLGERLRREATHRPAAREQIELLLQDLARDGIELVRTRQVLAEPLGADYCAAALSARGLGLSLCAFADAARAEQGKSRSRASFDRLIPDRTLLRRGAVLLTLTRAAGAEAAEESERVAQRFATSTRDERASL